MKGYIGETAAFDLAITPDSDTYSRAFGLRGWNRVAVVCMMGSAAGTDGAIAPTQCATFSVVCGKSTDAGAAMTALTGATMALGCATAGDIRYAQEVMVVMAGGSITTGKTIIINEATYTFNNASSIAEKICINKTGDLSAAALASAIRFHQAQTVGVDYTAGTSVLLLKPRLGPEHGGGLRVTVVTNSSVTGIHVQSEKAVGVIDFTAADVIGQNSSYDHFCVRMSGTTVAQFTAMVVRYGDRNVKQGQRTQV
jgi:hypothetical protein